MKRYRVLAVDFDTRATILSLKIDPAWDANVRDTWRSAQETLRTALRAQFGEVDAEEKERNFCEMGAAPFSVIGYHNAFLRQARAAFVIGAYYPALTAACCLGERILNHLILDLRDDFDRTAEYKRVYDKQSFDDWRPALAVLRSWGVLRPNADDAFKQMHRLRNASVHFQSDLRREVRARAAEAIRLISEVVEQQFGAFGPHPWFIPNAHGVSFLTAASTGDPFVRKFYLPSCALVGPRHTLEEVDGRLVPRDDHAYPERELSDEEFLRAFHDARQSPQRSD